MALLVKVIHVDGQSSPPDIKISMSEKAMKQVTIHPGLIGENDIGDKVASLLASLKSGEWNEIQISPPQNGGKDPAVTPQTVSDEDLWKGLFEFHAMCIEGAAREYLPP